MKFGIEFVPMDLYWRTVFYTIQAEKLGYDHVWITDHFNNRNVYVTLTLIANYTERIKLGPGVTNPYLVHPVMTAQAVASLNEIAPGRVVCGIGAGDKTTLEMVGLEMKTPLRAVREAVEIIRRMVAREKGGYEGRVFRTRGGARFNFKVPQPIPIYIGAQGPKMLRLAGSLGDGVLINASHPKDFEAAKENIDTGLSKAGKSRDAFDTVAYAAMSVDKDRDKARNAARIVVAFIVAGSPEVIFERHGISMDDVKKDREALHNAFAKGDWGGVAKAVTDEMIDRFSISGNPEEVIERIKELSKTGVTQVVAGSPIGPDKKKSIQLIGKEIIPAFK